ncbi:FLX-like protein 2 [Tanacetum coccineum]
MGAGDGLEQACFINGTNEQIGDETMEIALVGYIRGFRTKSFVGADVVLADVYEEPLVDIDVADKDDPLSVLKYVDEPLVDIDEADRDDPLFVVECVYEIYALSKARGQRMTMRRNYTTTTLNLFRSWKKNYMTMAGEVEKLRTELKKHAENDKRAAGQNTYDDAYGVSQGRRPLPGGVAAAPTDGNTAVGAVGAQVGHAAARTGYDAYKGSGPAGPGYDMQRGPGQAIPGYDVQTGPRFPKGPDAPAYDPQRGLSAPAPAYDP